MGRVKVKFPTLSATEEGWWARICVPSSGKERGLLMLPQADEEVLVGFEHGDITRPYVVGSLFNGKDAPGTVLAASDGSFGLLSDQKIVTTSKKATELTSQDAFSFKASQALTISSDQSVKVSTNGSQIQIQAPTGSLEISAMSIKLSATGTVQISGASIMLG
jgi:uncharacterized protein involved in type VI secretion and phage assembly